MTIYSPQPLRAIQGMQSQQQNNIKNEVQTTQANMVNATIKYMYTTMQMLVNCPYS